MDVLFGYLPRRVRRAVRRVEAIVLFVLASVVVWESAGYVRLMVAIGRQSDAAGIPMGVPHAAVTIGFTLIALIAAARLGRAPHDEIERS
jgi:TRAP-type C4-dicarboxylate transport system permease small subunit